MEERFDDAILVLQNHARQPVPCHGDGGSMLQTISKSSMPPDGGTVPAFGRDMLGFAETRYVSRFSVLVYFGFKYGI